MFYKKKSLSIFFYILLIASCEKTKIEEVKLSFIENDEGLFQKMITPLNYSTNLDLIEGIPEQLDVFRLFYLEYNPKSQTKKMFKSNQFTQLNSIESLELLNSKEKIWAITGLKNDSIILKVDFNRNKNFSDDIDFNFGKKINYDKFDSINFNELNRLFNTQFDQNGINLTGKIIPFPNYYNEYNYDSITNSLQLAFIPFGYWKGYVKNKDHKLAIQNLFLDLPKILISTKESDFKTISNPNYFPYILGDKVFLGRDLFLLKSIDYLNENLKLQRLKSFGDNKEIGIRKNFYIENFQILNIINNEKCDIDKVIKDKDYLIIDFWGTWCKPCLELIPDLKRIRKKFKNIEILGIALDKNERSIKEHILKERIEWDNHFISFEKERDTMGIIRKLRIENFPTYLLIDKKRKILYRGIGKEGLEKIQSLLTNLI